MPFHLKKASAGAILAILPVLVLPGCALPELEAVPEKEVHVPKDFNGSESGKNSARLDWREFFQDAELHRLIGEALSGNQELKMLGQEIRMAGYEIGAKEGEYLPSVSLGAGAGIEKSSANTRDGVVEENHKIHDRSFPEPLPDFMVGDRVSWEVDIWNRLHDAKKAAVLRYMATWEGQAYAVTRLVAEVAEKYYELLALDGKMAVLDRTIAIQSQSLEIAQAEKSAARGTELAVQRFQAEVQKNQSEKWLIKQEMAEVENRINFLLGRFPRPIERGRSPLEDITLRRLDVGIPSQMLQNRPDIRQAELELAASGLDVQVAKARFYPRLDLTAGIGYQAFNPKYLLSTPESLVYNAAGELVMPVINRRGIEADYRSANARQIQCVYRYQQTVLKAYVEVVNFLSRADNYDKSVAVKKQQLASLARSVESATQLFKNARAEYMEVLLAQRDMLEAKMTLIETKKQQLTALVNAYQALGGGGQMPERKP